MTNNPITAAKAATPWWMKDIRHFDGLEIHPVRDISRDEPYAGTIPQDQTWCEPCEPGAAEFWSVYGHYTTGGIACFEDLPSEEEAQDFADTLLKAYPHLRVFGLLG